MPSASPDLSGAWRCALVRRLFPEEPPGCMGMPSTALPALSSDSEQTGGGTYVLCNMDTMASIRQGVP